MKISYATKIWVSIALLSVGTAVLSVSYFYIRSRALILDQMGGRLADIGRTAAHYFGPVELQRIERLKIEGERVSVPLDLISQGMEPGEYRTGTPAETAQKIMAGEDFQGIVAILRKIKANTSTELLGKEDRKGEPTIRFATILTRVVGDPGGKIIRFLADADYDSEELPNPYGNIMYGNSEALLWAFSGKVSADDDFRHEDGQVLLSAGIPLFDESGKILAVLALDYDAAGEANAVNQLLYWSWGIVATSLVLSILIAALLSRMLNRPIEILRAGAERVRDRDFDTRVSVTSKDELGLLGMAFNNMVQEIQSYAENLETSNAAFARFVPREFLKQLGHESIVDVKLGDHVQQQMTVLFSDIRSFSTITEYMSPRDSFEFINDYLKTVSPVIRQHGGFIDKYIGDGVMALFPGGPEAAVRAAIEMQQAIADFNSAGEEYGRAKIKIGIGIHHGNLMLGTVGESERMDGTVIADAVNLASRLESLTKEYHSGIIASERVARSISNKEEIYSRYLGTVKVKGKQTAVEIFEVFAGQSTECTRIKIVSRQEFQRAVQALESNDAELASRLLQEIINQNPSDETAKYFLERCRLEIRPEAVKTKDYLQ